MNVDQNVLNLQNCYNSSSYPSLLFSYAYKLYRDVGVIFVVFLYICKFLG